MSYAAASELQARLTAFPALLQDAGGAFDAVLAQSLLDAASAEVDSNAGMRYATPVAASSASYPMLKSWELTLAEELAYAADAAKGELPPSVAARVQAVRDSLKRLSDGLLKLDAVESASSAGGASIVEGDEPLMTRAKLGGW